MHATGRPTLVAASEIGIGHDDPPRPPDADAPRDDSQRIRDGKRPAAQVPAGDRRQVTPPGASDRSPDRLGPAQPLSEPAADDDGEPLDNGASPADEAHDRLRDNDRHSH